MKTQFIFLILLFTISCKAQNQSIDMEKFDKQLYEQNKDKAGNYEYLTKNRDRDSIRVKLSGSGGIYQKIIYKTNTPFSVVYEYDKNTLNITRKLELFYNCGINKMYEYNPDGKLIKETDLDAPFKFTWQDLVKTMKAKYDVDLMDMSKNKQTTITRNSEMTLYFISIPTGKFEFVLGMNSKITETYNIDGNTGETIYWRDKDGEVQIDKKSERFSKNTKDDNKGFWSTLMS